MESMLGSGYYFQQWWDCSSSSRAWRSAPCAIFNLPTRPNSSRESTPPDSSMAPSMKTKPILLTSWFSRNQKWWALRSSSSRWRSATKTTSTPSTWITNPWDGTWSAISKTCGTASRLSSTTRYILIYSEIHKHQFPAYLRFHRPPNRQQPLQSIPTHRPLCPGRRLLCEATASPHSRRQ